MVTNAAKWVAVVTTYQAPVSTATESTEPDYAEAEAIM